MVSSRADGTYDISIPRSLWGTTSRQKRYYSFLLGDFVARHGSTQTAADIYSQHQSALGPVSQVAVETSEVDECDTLITETGRLTMTILPDVSVTAQQGRY